MVNRFLILVSIALSAVLLAMMNFTNPSSVGPLGVLVFFTTLYIITFGISSAIVAIFFKIRGKNKMNWRRYTYSAILALAPIMLLVMRPFMGVSVFSVVITLSFVLIGWVLTSKA